MYKEPIFTFCFYFSKNYFVSRGNIFEQKTYTTKIIIWVYFNSQKTQYYFYPRNARVDVFETKYVDKMFHGPISTVLSKKI